MFSDLDGLEDERERDWTVGEASGFVLFSFCFFFPLSSEELAKRKKSPLSRRLIQESPCAPQATRIVSLKSTFQQKAFRGAMEPFANENH